ncbi:hypothetical protein C5E45_25605 [Nocardia nova]|uniref:Uncharacterized protein n=1 Tax=Nocardia nova TaxID=37330 RepID=A0A2S6AJQ9_9NOCA|nr:hypothetical protein C5E41_19655 [Nocardia nova]PPJ35447.1 hypothetical protein C5E45_25605 [Nocardia nova]
MLMRDADSCPRAHRHHTFRTALACPHRRAILTLLGCSWPAMHFGSELGDVGPTLRLGFGCDGRGGQTGAVACHGAFDRLAEVPPDIPGPHM